MHVKKAPGYNFSMDQKNSFAEFYSLFGFFSLGNIHRQWHTLVIKALLKDKPLASYQQQL